MFVLVNLYGDVIESLGRHATLEEAEAVARAEWAKGWEVYTKTAAECGLEDA